MQIMGEIIKIVVFVKCEYSRRFVDLNTSNFMIKLVRIIVTGEIRVIKIKIFTIK